MSFYLGKSIYSLSEPDTAKILAQLLGQPRQHWEDFLIGDRKNGSVGWVSNELQFKKSYKRAQLEFRYPDYALAKFIGDRNLLALLRFVARYPRITVAALLRVDSAKAILGPGIIAAYCESVQSYVRVKKNYHMRMKPDEITSSAICDAIPFDVQEKHGIYLEKDGPQTMDGVAPAAIHTAKRISDSGALPCLISVDSIDLTVRGALIAAEKSQSASSNASFQGEAALSDAEIAALILEIGGSAVAPGASIHGQ